MRRRKCLEAIHQFSKQYDLFSPSVIAVCSRLQNTIKYCFISCSLRSLC